MISINQTQLHSYTHVWLFNVIYMTVMATEDSISTGKNPTYLQI